MEENGFTASEFEQTFKMLKEYEGILKYSRSTPRGYSIEVDGSVSIPTVEPATLEKEPPKPKSKPKPQVSKPVPEVTDIAQHNEAFLNLVKENQPVSSKAKLLELAETINIDKKSAEKIINLLKESGELKYSKSAPRGWSV